MDTAVDDAQKLIVSTWITEEARVDGERAAGTTATHLTQRVLHVEVTVTCVRHTTSCRSDRVIASVPRSLEHQHHVPRIIIPAAAGGGGDAGGGVARQVEDGVEAGVTSLWRWQRVRRTDHHTTCNTSQTTHDVVRTLYTLTPHSLFRQSASPIQGRTRI